MRWLFVGAAVLTIAIVAPSCSDDEPVFRTLNNDDNCLEVDVVETAGDDDDDTTGTADDDDDSAPGDDDDATAGDDDDSAVGDDDDSAAGDDDDDSASSDDDDSAGGDDDDSASGVSARDGDDDDSAAGVFDNIPEDAAWTELTCCGGPDVIGVAWVSPASAPPGEDHLRYTAVQVDRAVFEDNGYNLAEIVRVTVSFDPRGVGEGEAELEQNGLDETLWEGWLGCGELGGVPRTDEFCFHLWGEEESEEE